MGKNKKKRRSSSFAPGFDSRRNSGSQSTTPVVKGSRKRFSWQLLRQARDNEGVKSIFQLPGVRLRPKVSPPTDVGPDSDQSNDIVDLQLLNAAHADSLKQHQAYILSRRRPATRHTVSLSMKKRQNVGFGVTVSFKCSQCQFHSPTYKLYHETAAGGCVTNAAAGAALTKVAVKASDASFFMASLNVNGPCEKTYQRYVNDSCAVADDLLEDAVADNREITTDYLHVVGRVDDPNCPGSSVSVDGQYNRPIYHGYDGKSSSVSEPALENETGLNLLVAHAVKSKWDGSYPVDKVDCFWLGLSDILISSPLLQFMCLCF